MGAMEFGPKLQLSDQPAWSPREFAFRAVFHDSVLSTNILNSSDRGAPGPSGRFPVYMAVGDRKTRPRSTEMTYRALC